MTYQIVRDTSILGFETSVNSLLAEGWELYGDFTISGGVFYQVMTQGSLGARSTTETDTLVVPEDTTAGLVENNSTGSGDIASDRDLPTDSE
jgi:hypothetical protein